MRRSTGTAPGTGGLVRYGLTVPQSWFVVDLDAEDPVAAAPERVEERLAVRPDLGPVRAELIEVVEVFTRESLEREAIGAALFLDLVEGIALMATLQTMVTDRDPTTAVARECSRLARVLSSPRPGDTRVPEVAAAVLGATPAVRVACAREAEAADGTAPIVEYVEHWVPLPDQPLTLLLAAESPHPAFAGELAAAFDRIAATLVLEPAPPP